MKSPHPAVDWHGDDRHLAKWIPFVGPAAAVVLLFLIYVILSQVFSYLPPG